MVNVSIVLALAADRGMGKDGNGRALWYMPEDLQRFRQITSGHPVIIAEATFAAILATLGTSLPNRVNVVVSQKLELEENNGIVVSSLEEGFKDSQGVG